MSSLNPSLTIYFDGSCALCRAEIAHYRRQDGANKLCFVDISKGDASMEPDLGRADAMARFHVRGSDGVLLSGAAAFVSIWSRLPRWRWAARMAALPGFMALLEFAYRRFLPVRPIMARAFNRLQASTRKAQARCESRPTFSDAPTKHATIVQQGVYK